ncbi:MAG: fatty acid desaturase family protein [Myxococcota bacterium]
MTKPTDLLSKAEIREFTRASDLEGWRSVLTDWGLIAAALGLVAVWPNVLTGLVALVVLGGRQLGLAILTHECAHHSLFATRWLNDVVGVWIAGSPIWLDVHRYRLHHRAHHLNTGTDDDPDLALTTGFPTTRASLARKFARDLTGLTAAKRVIAQLAMDFGFLHYTASTDARRRTGLSAGERLAMGARHLAPVVASNAVLFGVLALLGQPWLYLLWVGAWFTTYNLVLRIRSIAEHAVMERSEDPFTNTRTTLVSPLERFLMAPHHVNYHLEHHFIMGVPHWRLPALHARLTELGVVDEANTVHGYTTVLGRIATA